MKRNLISASVAAALLAACASTPDQMPEIEQARARVQALAQDPLVAQAASRDLEEARAALANAERALEEGKDKDEIVHLAYLADRRAEIGQTRVKEAWARDQVAKAESERNRVLLEARTAEAERRTQEAQAATQQARAAQADAQMQSQQAQQSREETLRAQAELENLQRQLTELNARPTERGMVLTLGDVLFDTAQATLKPGAQETIGRLGSFLEKNPETRIIIEGHTDSRGSDAYNEDLSQRRAQAVADALTARGIDATRFQILGRGEAYPVASNDNTAGQQQNRRVEIVFSDQGGTFAQGATDSSLR